MPVVSSFPCTTANGISSCCGVSGVAAVKLAGDKISLCTGASLATIYPTFTLKIIITRLVARHISIVKN